MNILLFFLFRIIFPLLGAWKKTHRATVQGIKETIAWEYFVQNSLGHLQPFKSCTLVLGNTDINFMKKRFLLNTEDPTINFLNVL
jgi:hypothetical protein